MTKPLGSHCGGSSRRSFELVAYDLIRLFGLLAFYLAIPSSLCAHPFHLCVGQMKWNTEAKVWEVSLRLHPQDLEKAMNAELQKAQRTQQITIDDDGFPELATNYLASHFYVRRCPLAMNNEEFNAILRSSKATSWTTTDFNQNANGNSDRDQSSLKWIGMEQERGWLWIHLELRQPNVQLEKQKLWMVNRILLDAVERQENTIAIDPVLNRKFSLQFRSAEEFQEMKPKN